MWEVQRTQLLHGWDLATGHCFRRNSNFIKPRQSEQKPVSTELQPTTGLPEIPQESPILQQPAVPSSQATSTVDAIPTVPPLKQNGNSTPRTPRQPRVSRRSIKGIPPTRLGLQKWYSVYRHSSCIDILISEREMLRYGSEWHYWQNRIKSIFRLVKW